MGLINFNDSHKTHVPEIDAQHEHLIGLINQLHDAMAEGQGLENLHSMLTALVDFTREHFAYEERLMVEHGYPDTDQHMGDHQRLLKHIETLADKATSEDSLLSFAVVMDLKAWATVHIEKADKPLGAFLNG